MREGTAKAWKRRMAAGVVAFSFASASSLPGQAVEGVPTPQFSVAPYDVASIRSDPSNSGNMHLTTGNGSFLAENATLRFAIRFAYDLPDKLLVGGPAWVSEKHFDIKAKADGVPSVDQKNMTEEEREAYGKRKQIPLQALLADRFQLKIHREDRVMPMYSLVVAKGGTKVKASSAQIDADQLTAAGSSTLGSGPRIRRTRNAGRIVGIRATLDDLARYLTTLSVTEVDRPVVNKTGLSGEYDFALEWTPGMGADGGDDAPSLFRAIQEQLGLKLEAQKGPVEVTVVDKAEMPSEN